MDIIPSSDREKRIARDFWNRGARTVMRLHRDIAAERLDYARQKDLACLFPTGSEAQRWDEDRAIEELGRPQ